MEKFRGPIRGPKRARNAKKSIFPVLGAVLGEMPADQICLHAKCGPTEPCLGSQVSLGSEIRVLLGGLGAILSVGDRFCLLGTQPTKNRCSRNSAPPGVFGIFLARLNRSCGARLSYYENVGWVCPSFSRNSRFTGFWGDGGQKKIRGRPGPEAGQKRPKGDFPGLGVRSGRDARRPNLIAC